MKDSRGTKFPTKTVRFTETDRYGELGDVLVRERSFEIRLTPNITVGGTHTDYYPDSTKVFAQYKDVDTFNYFEFELRDKRFLWRRDKELARIISGGPAVVEFWTENSDGAWIHWIFPFTMWSKSGWGFYEGRSYEGPNTRPDDWPDDSLSVSNGGFFKTEVAPPFA